MDEREKELVRKAQSGESSAFEQLVLSHRRPLFHLAYRLTGNMEEAMDLAQETLLRSFRYLHRFDPDRNFRNWLFQIAANLARDWQRRKKNSAAKIPDEDYPSNNHRFHRSAVTSIKQSTAEISSDIKIDINSCLDQLGPRERQVFILRDLEDLSIKETASLLRTSSLSVRVSLSSARQKIRQIISGQKASPVTDEDKNEM